jgi:hypothetical protein
MAYRAPGNSTLQRLAFGAPAQKLREAMPNPTSYFKGSNTYDSNGFVNTILKYGFYTSLAALLLFLILVVVHYTITPVFSFTVGDGIITIPTTQDSQSAFTASVATVDISANFVNPASCVFTIIFDIFLQGDFKSTTAPRVLTYRSPTAVDIDTSPDAFTPELDLPGMFPNTNFIVWIDPEKNDLYAGVVTQEPNEASVITVSEPVKNVPIRSPFRATFTLSPNFMEIYINGRLEQTVSIVGTVLQSQFPFFGPVKVCDQSIFIANMYYWQRILSPSEIRINGANIASSVFNNIA